MTFGAAGNLLYSRGSQSVGHDLSVGHQNPGVVSDQSIIKRVSLITSPFND